MKGIEDYVDVSPIVKERFKSNGYFFRNNSRKVTFHNREGKTLFELNSGCETDEITVKTKDNCYSTNQIIITCDSDGTPTLYFNSMQYGLILLNVDNEGNELMFFL